MEHELNVEGDAQDRGVYRPATALVRLLMVAFMLLSFLALVAAGSTWMEIELLKEMQAGGAVTEDQILANDARQALIGVAGIGLYIVTVVLFCMWVFRANKNARALGADEMQMSAGGCVGWFFVPIANLFKPYQGVQEIWKASDPAGDRNWMMSAGSTTIALWWLLWIADNVIGQTSFRMTMSAETIDAAVTADWVSVVSCFVEIAAAFAAVAVVTRINDRQELKFMGAGAVSVAPGLVDEALQPSAMAG